MKILKVGPWMVSETVFLHADLAGRFPAVHVQVALLQTPPCRILPSSKSYGLAADSRNILLEMMQAGCVNNITYYKNNETCAS
jgi:hypothetical protein